MKFIQIATALVLCLLLSIDINAQVVINELMSKNDITLEDEFGDFPDWIELKNIGSSNVDLTGFFLTDNPENMAKWKFPSVVIPANSYLIIFASGRADGVQDLHVDFKLSSVGEYIGLSDTQGNIVDEIKVPELSADFSYARLPDGIGDFSFTNMPSPSLENSLNGSIEQLATPRIIFDEYFNAENATIKIDGEGEIYYTLDGSIPSESSVLYTASFSIDNSFCIRARSFAIGKVASAVESQTVFVDVDHDLAVIALMSDPINLWDEEKGILVKGPNADSVAPFYGANFWLNKSIPMEIMLFDEQQELKLQQKAKAEVHGGRGARTLPQKPLRITATKTYGPDKFNFPFFDYRDIIEYKHLVLRNSSGDWGNAHIRDAYLCKYIETEGLNVDVPGYRPAAVYMNGEYYGIMNMRDKLDEFFLNEKHGADPLNVDFLERDTITLAGDFNIFFEMFDFVISNDLSLQENFDSVGRLFEIGEVTDYFILETMLNNFDWPQNNIKYWREKKAGAKWRYVLFDLDGCCGRYPWSEALRDNINSRFEDYADNYLIRIMGALFENTEYRNQFINRYSDILNTSFRSEKIIDYTYESADLVSDEMRKHFKRWYEGSFETWQDVRIPFLAQFFEERPTFVRAQLQHFFDIDTTFQLNISTFPIGAGKMKLNTISPEELPWSGTYFKNIPIDLEVIPNPGFTFSHWQFDSANDNNPSSASFQKAFQADQTIIAVFEEENIEGDPILFPNPATDFIQIILPKNFNPTTTQIFDALGKEIYYFKGFQGQIDVSNYTAGLYFLRLLGKDGVVKQSKFFVE